MSQELDKPKFAAFGLFWFEFLFVFCFRAAASHHYHYFSALLQVLRSSVFSVVWLFAVSSRLLLFLSKGGLVVILFVLRIPDTKHCAEVEPILAINGQQSGTRWERPGILPG